MNKNNVITNDKKKYIKLLSVVSAFAVVMLHTNGCFWNFSKEKYWFSSNIIECIFYFAVPIFFMITGVNLIDYQKKYDTKFYFKKRIKKTFIPFLFWSLIALLYKIIYENAISIHDLNIYYILNGIFNSGFISIYWFFIPLFCMYLIIPVLSSIDENKKKCTLTYLAIILLITNSLIPFIIKVFNLNIIYPVYSNITVNFSFPITINIIAGSLFYVIIGYLLDKYDFKKKQRLFIYFFSIIGLLMHILGTYFLSVKANKLIDTYKGYYSIPCILYSIGIFLFIKQISNKIKKYKIIDFINKYTFSIYLLHWYVLRIITREFNLDYKSIIYRLGLPVIIIIICILIAYLLRKIPIIKKIIP